MKTMPNVSASNKIIAKTAAKMFGGKAKVTRYWDDEHKSFVDILVCRDAPQVGVNSYATVCLSDTQMYLNGKEYPARLEMVGACGQKTNGFENALATAAFFIINSEWCCYPGAIFPDVLRMYALSSTMQHFLFTTPYLWENLKTLDLPDKKVAWLLAVPISDAERQYADEHGAEKLENVFVEIQIDIFNINRISAV